MKSPIHRIAVWLLRLVYENRGQDLIEYALLAAAVAVAAGALLPPMSGQIGAIFSKIASLAARAPG